MSGHPADDVRPVLVTGAAGFLGSHLCDRLLERGLGVIGLDDLSTGDLAHVAHLLGHARFRFIRHDITQELPDEIRGIGRIFNLACPPSPAYYQQHPVSTVLASTLGVWRLLELARRERARLLQASTSEVYGDPQVHPQPEGYWGHVNPIGPRACYDEGKRCAEAMCLAYRTEHALDIRIARLFNSYGPRLRPGDGRVVSNFIVQALAGEPLTVYGDGSQTRSFCYVGDTVEGLLKLMDSDLTEPVNLGNPDEFTVLELAERVRLLTHSRSPITFGPLPPDDPVRRRPDIGRARAQLGWQPGIGLDEGLQMTIPYFEQLGSGARAGDGIDTGNALNGAPWQRAATPTASPSATLATHKPGAAARPG
jgi:UDP-glucuronate decarboxylase